MAALVSLSYPIATFFTLNKPQSSPRISVIRCSVRVSSALPSRRIRRKNYLRPKILKTLTKPYPTPLPVPPPEDLETRVEPTDVVTLEPAFEKSDYGGVEELETSVEGDEGGLGEVEVVRDADVMGFKGFPGRTMFKVFVSFVGLFVLQTAVSVWIMGSGESGEKDKRSGIVGRYARESGSDGNFGGESGLTSVDELKIAEIRGMARVVRESEKRKKNTKKDEEELENESDEEDDEDFETDNSPRNGIATEIDGRLTMLRKRSAMPMQNVNFLKRAENVGKDVQNDSVVGNRLIFEAKRQFRSQATVVSKKPKGFEGINDVRGNDAKSGRTNVGMGKDEVMSVSQSSKPLQASKKMAASEEENLGKASNGSSRLRSAHLSNGMNKAAKPENGVHQDSNTSQTLGEGAKLKESSVIEIQESREKKNDLHASTATTHARPRRNEKYGSKKLNSKLSRRTNMGNKKNGGHELWWSTLPCVFAILMQKGRGSELQQGFYTLHVNSDTEYTSYTVAFEDQNDARNFSYILDSVFGDLPDAAVDVVLMSTQELREIIDSVNKNVMVARKGELKLYAGQPLEDVESALRMLVK